MFDDITDEAVLIVNRGKCNIILSEKWNINLAF